MTTTSSAPVETQGLSRTNKIGLVLAAVLGVGDLTSPFQSMPDGQDGPPYAILLLGGVLGLLTLAAVVVAFRKAHRGALRLVAGTRVLSAVTALPAFFVDVPAALKVLVGVVVLVTIASSVMVLSPARSRASITD